MWNFGTTFDYGWERDYKYALTHSKPNDLGLWFRLPESLKDSLNDERLQELEWKIKEALGYTLNPLTSPQPSPKERGGMSLYDEYRKLERTKEWCLELIEKIKSIYNKYGYEFDENLIPQDLRDIYQRGYESHTMISAKDFHSETLKFVKNYAPELKKQVLKLL